MKKFCLASALVACIAGFATPVFADDLSNPHPTGCFAALQLRWNASPAAGVRYFERFYADFESCAREQASDEIQARSNLVGAFASAVYASGLYAESNDVANGNKWYAKACSVIDQAVRISKASGDPELAAWATKRSEVLGDFAMTHGLDAPTKTADVQ